MTDQTELPRQALWKPPPSWLLPGSDEPIPQPIIEAHAKAADDRAMLAEKVPHLAAVLALPQILDTPWHLDWAKVKQLGYGGANRYMCADWNTGPGTFLPQKRPTYAEVQQMLDLGLDFWWNYEDGADDFNDGYNAWLIRGRRAADYGANVLKLPQGVGCYASMDMDPGLQPKPVHFESQRGFRDGYGLGPAGIYGGVPAINAFADAGTSHLGWISLAKSWSHGVLPDPGRGHLDQVGQAFGGSADTNNQLLAPSGSYLHALGGDMPLTDAEWAKLTKICHDQAALALREQFGGHGAEVYDRVTQLVRTEVNDYATGAELAALNLPPLTPEQVDAAVKAMTAAVLAAQPSGGTFTLTPAPPAP